MVLVAVIHIYHVPIFDMLKKKVNTDEYSGIRRVAQLDTGKKTGNNYVHLTKTAAQACDP